MSKKAKASKSVARASEVKHKKPLYASLLSELEHEMAHAESDDDDFDCMLELLSSTTDKGHALEVELFRRKDGKVGKFYVFLEDGRVLRMDDCYPHPQKPPEPFVCFLNWEFAFDDLLDSLRSVHRRRLEGLNRMGTALDKASQPLL